MAAAHYWPHSLRMLTCLSPQLWQCGGTMLDAPCSRIGHIYRKFAPFPNPGVGDFVGRVSADSAR